MARKLAISDKVQFPVTLVASSAGRSEKFTFTLTATRLDGEVLRKQLQRDDLSVADFLPGIVTGWEGQKLVIEEDGTPSAFSPEAFGDMLGVAGAPRLILDAYLAEVTVKAKN